MNKLKVLIIFFTSLHVFSQQSGVVEYRFSYTHPKEIPQTAIKENAQKTVAEMASYALSHNYVLEFNSNSSMYDVKSSMSIDNTTSEFMYEFSHYMFSMGQFYQDKESNEVLNKLHTLGEDYLVIDVLLASWEITQESKDVGGYKCYKAISKCNSCSSNQEVIAWFTLDIPLSYGPGGYGGLPGLILEITKYRYTLTLKNLKLVDTPIEIEKPTGGEIISREDFDVMLKGVRKGIKKS